ncbi:MAG: DUF72 domain-containing protein [Bacteroidetes bacterium]|nr:DUF72 domain-containing protein [Bacteroidota bacterium]
MEFGKVETSLLESVNFRLPPDPQSSRSVLAAAKKKRPKKPIVKVGGAKWGRKDWINKIYPKGTKEANFLEVYASMFETIEMNSLFYRIQPSSVVEKWTTKVGPNFTFCPKFYQGITHIKRLKDAEEWTNAFLNSISGFGKHIGPSFIQLSDNFGPKNFDILSAYLSSLPTDLDVFLEVRHKDWFLPEHTERLFALLRERNQGWVITDTSGRRDCLHMQLPVPRAFIRYVGNNLHPTDFTRIDEWAERTREWLDQGMHSVYFFVHQHDELYAPELLHYSTKRFNEVCGATMPVPKLLTESMSLF